MQQAHVEDRIHVTLRSSVIYVNIIAKAGNDDDNIPCVTYVCYATLGSEQRRLLHRSVLPLEGVILGFRGLTHACPWPS